jgi:hypothetical protein
VPSAGNGGRRSSARVTLRSAPHCRAGRQAAQSPRGCSARPAELRSGCRTHRGRPSSAPQSRERGVPAAAQRCGRTAQPSIRSADRPEHTPERGLRLHRATNSAAHCWTTGTYIAQRHRRGVLSVARTWLARARSASPEGTRDVQCWRDGARTQTEAREAARARPLSTMFRVRARASPGRCVDQWMAAYACGECK